MPHTVSADQTALCDLPIEELAERANARMEDALASQLEVGDIVLEMTRRRDDEGRQLSLKQAHQRYLGGWSYSYLCRLRRVAEAFPAGPVREQALAREPKPSHEDLYAACRNQTAGRRFRGLRETDVFAHLDAHLAASARGENRTGKGGLKRLAKEEREANLERYRRSGLAPSPVADVRERMVRGCCLDFMRSGRIAPGSLAMLFADPPYITEMRGAARTASPWLSDTADSRGRDGALALTLAIIELGTPLLREDGVLALWGSGNRPDEPEVVLALRERGYVVHPLYWRRPPQARQSGGGVCLASTERLLLCGRSPASFAPDRSEVGDAVVQELPDGEALADALAAYGPPTREPWAEGEGPGDRSMYEKPVGLCELLLHRLTRRGDLVYDCCGCTGSMARACLRTGRDWWYTESDDENFGRGKERIEAEFEALGLMRLPKAGPSEPSAQVALVA